MLRRTVGAVAAVVAVFGLFAALDGQVPREAGTWSPAGALAGAREGAASVLLPDGRVLVLGGRSADGASTSTEVYAGGAWTAADAVVQRWGHTATVLGDGRVLIAGGEDAAGLTPALDIYNPADGTLTPAGALLGPRKGHAATLLLDGRVLIAGGFDGQQVVSTVEVFDAEAGSVSGAPFTLTAARAGLSATTLIDGRVLLAGGNNGTDDLALVEVVNVTTGSVTVRAMSAPRRDHQAVLLPHNNHVLLIGGTSNGAGAGTELYRSWTAEFVATAAPVAARLGAAAAPLAEEGWALVAGGAGVASAERYAFATVTTDKDDYSPGEKVYVSGSGWQPNEELTLSLRELPAEHDSRTFTLTADGSGRLVNAFLFDVESHHAGVRFYLTARGAASQAQITFTDGTVRVRTAGTGGTASSPASLVSWVLYSNTTCDPGVGDANVVDSDSIVADPTGNGTNIPVDVPATRSLRLTASAISGFVFSTWANGNFTTGTFTPTSNPGCIVGDNSAQNTRVEYVAVQNRPTTTALARTTGSNPSTYGDTVTFTATVTATGGNPSGVGTVTFKLDGSTVLCSAVPLTGNVAACSPSRTVFRAPGGHTVTAEYSGGLGGSAQFGASVSSGLSHTILAKQVTAAFTADNKPYDSTTAATIATRSLTGVITGDVVTLTDGTAAFADKNVGTGKTVTATGFTLSGADAVGYSLAPGPWTATADITAVSATATVTGNNKVYDDTTAASLTCTVSAGVLEGDAVSCTAAGTFADQHVGTNKPITVSSVALGGADSGNYVLSTPPTAATANITPASLTVTVSGTNKTYNGSTAATLTCAVSGGLFPGDAVSCTAAGVFANKNAGTGKTINVTGVTLTDADSGNYAVSGAPTTATADITPKAVTGSFTADDKVYDGTTAAAVSGRSLAGHISGDDVALGGGTAAFDTKNVGNDKPVTLTGASLTGADATNYTLGTIAPAAADITPKAVTGSFTADDKVYDGNTSATVASRTLNGTIGEDNVALDGGTAAFDTKNVGNDKPVSLTGASLTGADATNYTLGTVAPAAADITAKDVTGSFTADDKVYDGNEAATVASRAVNGSIAGDDVQLAGGTAAFDSKNVGTDKPVTLTGAALAGSDAGNYSLLSVGGATADVTPKDVTGSFTAVDKVYDGNVAATVASRTVNGRIEGDDVALDGGTATFNNKNVAAAKPVTLTGATLVGADAGNYSLTSVGQAAADITRLTITGSFTAADKVYDGNTTAEVLTYDLTGEISGDDVALTGTGASFDDKHVGVDKTVTLGSGALQGADAGNYTLGTVAQATADITPLGITGSFTAANKVYDGTAAATIVDRTLAGTISGDSISMVGGTAAFDTRNVGVGKTVSASGFTLAGTDAPNYTLAAGPWTATANITAKPLTGRFTVLDKVYDGSPAATVVTRTLEGVVGDGEGFDSVALTGGTAAFADKNVGSGKVVTLTGAVLTGTDAGNYTLTMETATGSISAKQITGTFTAAGKVYDGLTDAGVIGRALVGKITGDDVELSGGVATFATKDAGVNKAVTLSGATLTGGDAGNYQLLSVAASAATISPKGITGGFTAADKVVDGTTAATITSRSLVGVIAPDVASLVGGTAVFADASVGANKVVTGSGFSLGGADAHNYSLVSVDTTLASIVYAPAGALCAGGPGRTILQPINADGTSVFKQGSTVPAKFRVCDASGNSIGTPGVVANFRLVQTMAGTATTVVNEEVISTAADPAFRWSPDGQQWIFNINTKKLTASQTYTYQVWLNDGTSFTFRFGLR